MPRDNYVCFCIDHGNVCEASRVMLGMAPRPCHVRMDGKYVWIGLHPNDSPVLFANEASRRTGMETSVSVATLASSLPPLKS